MFHNGGDPADIMKARGLEQLSDTDALEVIINDVVAQNHKAVDEYTSGKENALQFLVGQIMKASKGAANPQVAREMLLKKLS